MHRSHGRRDGLVRNRFTRSHGHGQSFRCGLSPIVFRIKGPDKIWTQYANGTQVNAINGDTGWIAPRGRDPILRSVNGQTLRQRGLPLPHVFLAWLEFDGTIRFAGEEQIDQSTTLRLEFAHRSGGGFMAFFDRDSGLLVRSQKGDDVTKYAFDEVDDIRLLSKVVTHRGLRVETIEFTEFDFDAEIPDDLFELPPEIQQAVAEQKESDR